MKQGRRGKKAQKRAKRLDKRMKARAVERALSEHSPGYGRVARFRRKDLTWTGVFEPSQAQIDLLFDTLTGGDHGRYATEAKAARGDITDKT